MSEKGSLPSHQGNKTKHSVIFFSFLVFQDSTVLEEYLAKAVSGAEVSRRTFSESAHREAAPGQDLPSPCNTLLLPRLSPDQQNPPASAPQGAWCSWPQE